MSASSAAIALKRIVSALRKVYSGAKKYLQQKTKYVASFVGQIMIPQAIDRDKVKVRAETLDSEFSKYRDRLALSTIENFLHGLEDEAGRLAASDLPKNSLDAALRQLALRVESSTFCLRPCDKVFWNKKIDTLRRS